MAQLVSLSAVERLSPTCIRVLGGNPGKFTLQGTNTYILGNGTRRILLDTGEGHPSWIASIKATLEQETATIDTALISHWHPDHTGGIRHLLQLMPEVKVYKHRPEPGQYPILDGQTFRVDGATLTAAYTPGHTIDHFVFVITEENAMLTGDNVLGQGTAVFENLVLYLESLEKMHQLFSKRAYPGHGPVVDDGPGKIFEYIEHRRQREEQVLNTLSKCGSPGEHGWTVGDIVEIIYPGISHSIYQAAGRGIRQILQKLEIEGRVRQDENRKKWYYFK